MKRTRRNKLSPFGRARLAQMRAFARFLEVVSRLSSGRWLICLARDAPLIGMVLRWLLGFHGAFASLEEAAAYAARYVPDSHEHPEEHDFQVATAKMVRESDYPMLFFLAQIKSELRSVFDLGGGIGRLFFVLDRHLRFSDELVWTIHDLPFRKQSALAFASSKNENRIVFADEFSAASGTDLLIAVGALHYFEPTLADLISTLDSLPRHVIVNRSPCSNQMDIVTVQDCGNRVVPCKLHSITKLISEMERLGYGTHCALACLRAPTPSSTLSGIHGAVLRVLLPSL